MSNINARKIAYDTLYEIFYNEAYSNIILNKFFKQNRIEEQNKRFISEIVYGTLKNKLFLEHILKTYSKGRVKPKVKVILLMSIYQIKFMDKTPNFAVIDEAVKLSKKIAGNITGKFVNGILRNIERNINDLALKYKNSEEQFCIENSCPFELYKILVDQYGNNKAKAIIESFNNKSENSIRYNPNKVTKKELLEILGNEAKESTICEDSIIIDKLDINSKYFKEGYYIIQDEASALVACSIGENIEEKYKILDTCAAPGGKSLHIASKYLNSTLISCDKYIHKLKLIEDNVNRLGLKNVRTRLQDGTSIGEIYPEKADCVLVDAPCSGLGILRHKPDLRWRKTAEDLTVFPPLQKKILESAAKCVKPGGTLVYSTCTMNRAENEDIVNAFRISHKDFEVVPVGNTFGFSKDSDYLSILPQDDGLDGFFIAKLRRK